MSMTTEEREHQNRMNALDNAVRHRLKEESADDIVKSAEKYYAFLAGSKKGRGELTVEATRSQPGAHVPEHDKGNEHPADDYEWDRGNWWDEWVRERQDETGAFNPASSEDSPS